MVVELKDWIYEKRLSNRELTTLERRERDQIAVCRVEN